MIVGGSKENHAKEWDLTSGSMLRELLFLDECGGLCASQDSTKIAGYRGKTVLLFDTKSQEQLASFTCEDAICHLRLSKDGETIVAGGVGGTVNILKFIRNA